jgi:hypothetical protein
MDERSTYRQRMVQRYNLSEPLLIIPTQTCEVSLHRQSGTGAVCTVAVTFHSAGFGIVREGMDWTTSEDQREIFGFVPPTTTAIEVTTEGRIIYPPHIIDDAFLTIVSLPHAVTLSFKNPIGHEVEMHHFPTWEPPLFTIWDRLQWILRQGRQVIRLLPVAKGSTTAHIDRKDKN